MCTLRVNTGISRHAVDLRALDLGIPVRALDEAQHQHAPLLPRERDDPVDHRARALLVGLHDETEAVPIRRASDRRRVARKDRARARAARIPRRRWRSRCRSRFASRASDSTRGVSSADHALALRPRIARMQRRELHRHAGSGDDAASRRRAADRVDRRFVRVVVALGIGLGQRRLAQHVERVRVAARFALAHVDERLVDRAAGDELAAEKAHREIHAFPDQRLAALAQQRRERLLERALVARIDELAGDEQAPRGGVDEQRRRGADMRAPVAAADLVADQAIARRCVRDAQQRLGDAHERDALAAVERELEHQRVDAARLRALGAHRFGESRRLRLRLGESSRA